jgi:serine/threonine protein kinase
MAMNAQQETLRSIGNWDLLEKLAESGIGALYKARNRDSGEIVALKVMPPFEAGNGQAFQRFARECRILSALNDPHIVRALDFGIEGYEPYLVMEFVEGDSLAQRLSREGCLAETEAVRLIADVAGALSRAHHRGLVHRNVSPSTILITADGQAKLTDLGVVKETEAREDLTRVGAVLGTPNFMAPEQLMNASKATPACDIYSLGATLYMAVTGKAPFGGCRLADMWAKKLRSELTPPKELVPTLSDRIDRAIRRAMSAQSESRHATCGEFVENLIGSGAWESQSGAEECESNGTSTASLNPGESVAPSNAEPANSGPPLTQAADSLVVKPLLLDPKLATLAADEGDGQGWLMFLAIAAAMVSSFLGGLYLLTRLV